MISSSLMSYELFVTFTRDILINIFFNRLLMTFVFNYVLLMLPPRKSPDHPVFYLVLIIEHVTTSVKCNMCENNSKMIIDMPGHKVSVF